MPRKAKAADLLFLSKAISDRLGTLRAGASLERRTGYTIGELVDKATADRVRLAIAFLRSAEHELAADPTPYRSVISRSYYCMYHTFRAVAYYVHGGDDHESHAKLPSAIPKDFPDWATWENDLKTARLERNRADYDPYPKKELVFQPVALTTLARARDLLPVARAYLRKRGCVL